MSRKGIFDPMTPRPIVWAAVPVPYALYRRLQERGIPSDVIVRILEQVLGQKVVPLPDAQHDG